MIDLTRLIILGVGIIIILIIYLTSQILLQKQTNKQKRSILRKVVRISVIVSTIIFIALVFGFDVQNVWLTIASVLGLVAIGFIAVWSLLGNILAAIIIFVSEPFRIESKIRFFENDIEGIVEEITFFYTILRDKNGNFIHVANTKFFQQNFVHIVNEPKRKINTRKKKKR